MITYGNEYRHYIYGLCFVLHEDIENTETFEKLVIYRNNGKVYAVPSKVFHGYTVHGEKRFEKVNYVVNV